MSTLLNLVVAVARKEHQCYHCHRPIHVGERYCRIKGFYHGDPQDTPLHTDCQEATNREAKQMGEIGESELCEERHDRGMTCLEMEHAKSAFLVKLASDLQKIRAYEEDAGRDEAWCWEAVAKVASEAEKDRKYTISRREREAWMAHCAHRFVPGRFGESCAFCPAEKKS